MTHPPSKLRESIGLGLTTLAIAITATITIATVGLAADSSARPNLLIVQTDEHHFNTLGCYGGTIVETPHVDWLAKNGARCTSFYATTPVCSPSRAAFVSGRYPHNTPVVNNGIPLDDRLVTFAEILRRQGYATGYAGKWHLDGGGKPQWEPERKFGFEDNRFMFNRGHWKMLEDTPGGPRVASRNAKGQPNYGLEGADEKSFTTDWLTDKTLEFIDANHGGPFCYMVSLPDPHGPNTVRPPYDTMYNDVEVPIPESLHKTEAQTPKWASKERGASEAQLAKIMPKYYGMVKCIDDNLGRLLESLEKHGILENTIVVFTADHGDLCGEHGRLNKGVPYEGSAKIPMVIYYQGKIQAGTIIDEALSCVDFLPTIIHLMGFQTTGQEEGRDASGLLTGSLSTGNALSNWNDVAFIRGTSQGGWLAVVTDRYKLVFSPSDRPWLFDLEEDPNELDNAFDDPQYRDVVEQLATQLADYCTKYNDPIRENPKMMGEITAATK